MKMKVTTHQSIHRHAGNVALSFEGIGQTIYLDQAHAAWLAEKLRQAVIDIEQRDFAGSRFEDEEFSPLRHHVTGAIERGEAEAIVGIPALSETDNQKIQAFLDWKNNFITVERFAEHYDITNEEALATIYAGRQLHNKTI